MSFIDYSSNTTAALQLSLVKSALSMADYRIQREKGSTRWQVWHRSKRKTQGLCILSYNGWGTGIGQWWLVYGEVPVQVIQIIKACVADEGDRHVQIPRT